ISPSRHLSAWKCRLNRPGSTRLPAASISVAPPAGSLGPTAAMRSPSMAMSTGCCWPRIRALRMRRLIWSRPLEDVQAAGAVDQIDQPAIVEAPVVALDALGARRHIRHERGDLARGMRVGDIDHAQAMGEPGDRDLGAADLLAELVQPGVVLLERAVLLGDLE